MDTSQSFCTDIAPMRVVDINLRRKAQLFPEWTSNYLNSPRARAWLAAKPLVPVRVVHVFPGEIFVASEINSSHATNTF
jgi:hypothetical protein